MPAGVVARAVLAWDPPGDGEVVVGEPVAECRAEASDQAARMSEVVQRQVRADVP